jgi:SOS-response transcriptional repressor LexA
MLPTLREGDRLLVRYGAAPRQGRLVVVRFADGVVAVKRACRREPGGWWVERDNPAVGVDSRTVGVIADDDVLATVVARAWPWRRVSRRP